jgi:hypothetical protein
MKLLKKWFRAEDELSVEPQAPGDNDEDTSFNRHSLESTSSSIFDSPDTHRVRILKPERARPANDDDNPGYDPYDTGRFDANEES